MDSNTYIIVVTYNGIKWISKCLESAKPYPVIIVDNNSSDGTVEFIENSFSNTVILKQNHNLGFGAANNIGIQYALNKGAEYLFLLNQDAYINIDCIQKLISVHKNNEEIGLLSPIHLNGKGNALDRLFHIYLQRYHLINQILSELLLSKTSEFYELPFVNAAAWLIPKSTIKKVGLFDKMFFHYGEDRNYCQRIEFHKLRIVIVPTAIVRHDREERKNKNIPEYSDLYYSSFEKLLKVEFGDLNLKNLDSAYKNKIKYFRKNFFKNILLLNFSKARNFKRKIKIMEENFKVIKDSVKNNKLGNNTRF